MKSLTITFVLILSQVFLLAQPDVSCLPEGIYFTTQAQIDSFQINYPNCAEIEGSMTINGDDIYNLNGLSVLTSIGGSLYIGVVDPFGDPSNPNLVNISGLENLTSIGGSLEICDNGALFSLSGLENLTSIGGTLWIGWSSLLSISDLENVAYIGGSIFINNSSLISLNGLENLTSIMGTLYIADNYSLSSLYGLENVTNIEGLLDIRDNANLQDLTGLNNLISVGNSLDISGNDALISLTGLDGLNTINGELEIGGGYPSDGNPRLTDISALENLAEASITNLKIRYNSSLSTCVVQSICEYLANPNGFFLINDNATGCNSPEEVGEACLTSIENHVETIAFDISPNPVTDFAEISQNIPGSGFAEICLYNTKGICIKSWKLKSSNADNNTYYLDLSSVPSGLYFCRILIGNEMVTKKLIKR
jgi:hypothetical protein